MKLRLVKKEPAARSVGAAVERPVEGCAYARPNARVAACRPRLKHELAVDHLCDHVLGRAEHVFISRTLARGVGHSDER